MNAFHIPSIFSEEPFINEPSGEMSSHIDTSAIHTQESLSNTTNGFPVESVNGLGDNVMKLSEIKTEAPQFVSQDIKMDEITENCSNCLKLQKKLSISRGWNRFFREKLINIDKVLHIITEFEHEKQKNLELQLAYDQRSREWSQQQEQLIGLLNEIQPLREKLKVAEENAAEEKKIRLKHQYMEESFKVTIQQLQAKVTQMHTISNPLFVENLKKKLSNTRSENRKIRSNLEFTKNEVDELRLYISNKHKHLEKMSKKLLWALHLADAYGKELIEERAGGCESIIEWDAVQMELDEMNASLQAQYESFRKVQRERFRGRKLELACIPNFLKWARDFDGELQELGGLNGQLGEGEELPEGGSKRKKLKGKKSREGASIKHEASRLERLLSSEKEEEHPSPKRSSLKKEPPSSSVKKKKKREPPHSLPRPRPSLGPLTPHSSRGKGLQRSRSIMEDSQSEDICSGPETFNSKSPTRRARRRVKNVSCEERMSSASPASGKRRSREAITRKLLDTSTEESAQGSPSPTKALEERSNIFKSIFKREIHIPIEPLPKGSPLVKKRVDTPAKVSPTKPKSRARKEEKLTLSSPRKMRKVISKRVVSSDSSSSSDSEDEKKWERMNNKSTTLIDKENGKIPTLIDKENGKISTPMRRKSTLSAESIKKENKPRRRRTRSETAADELTVKHKKSNEMKELERKKEEDRRREEEEEDRKRIRSILDEMTITPITDFTAYLEHIKKSPELVLPAKEKIQRLIKKAPPKTFKPKLLLHNDAYFVPTRVTRSIARRQRLSESSPHDKTKISEDVKISEKAKISEETKNSKISEMKSTEEMKITEKAKISEDVKNSEKLKISEENITEKAKISEEMMSSEDENGDEEIKPKKRKRKRKSVIFSDSEDSDCPIDTEELNSTNNLKDDVQHQFKEPYVKSEMVEKDRKASSPQRLLKLDLSISSSNTDTEQEDSPPTSSDIKKEGANNSSLPKVGHKTHSLKDEAKDICVPEGSGKSGNVPGASEKSEIVPVITEKSETVPGISEKSGTILECSKNSGAIPKYSEKSVTLPQKSETVPECSENSESSPEFSENSGTVPECSENFEAKQGKSENLFDMPDLTRSTPTEDIDTPTETIQEVKKEPISNHLISRLQPRMPNACTIKAVPKPHKSVPVAGNAIKEEPNKWIKEEPSKVIKEEPNKLIKVPGKGIKEEPSTDPSVPKRSLEMKTKNSRLFSEGESGDDNNSTRATVDPKLSRSSSLSSILSTTLSLSSDDEKNADELPESESATVLNEDIKRPASSLSSEDEMPLVIEMDNSEDEDALSMSDLDEDLVPPSEGLATETKLILERKPSWHNEYTDKDKKPSASYTDQAVLKSLSQPNQKEHLASGGTPVGTVETPETPGTPGTPVDSLPTPTSQPSTALPSFYKERSVDTDAEKAPAVLQGIFDDLSSDEEESGEGKDIEEIPKLMEMDIRVPVERSYLFAQHEAYPLSKELMDASALKVLFEDIIGTRCDLPQWHSLIKQITRYVASDIPSPNMASRLQPVVRMVLISILQSSPYEKERTYFLPPTIYKLFQIVRVLERNLGLPLFTVDTLVNVAAHKLILTKEIRPNSLATLTTWFMTSCVAQYNALKAPDDEDKLHWMRFFLVDVLFHHKGLVHDALIAAVNSSRNAFLRCVSYRKSTVLEVIVMWIAWYGYWTGPRASRITLIEDLKRKVGVSAPPLFPKQILKTALEDLLRADTEPDKAAGSRAGFLLSLRWLCPSSVIKELFPILKDVFYDESKRVKMSLESVKQMLSEMVHRARWQQEHLERFESCLRAFPIVR